MFVGTPAGGTPDIIAQLIASRIPTTLGQNFIVDNCPGASGLISAEGVARAQATATPS